MLTHDVSIYNGPNFSTARKVELIMRERHSTAPVARPWLIAYSTVYRPL